MEGAPVRFWFPAPPRPRPLALLALLAAAFALASLADAPRSEADPLDLGEENSWLRIQNIGRHAANIEVQFFDLDGDLVGADRCPRRGECEALAPGSGWSFFQQGYDPLDVGYRGSAVVAVDQPFVALLARDVFQDGLFRIGGDALSLAPGSATHFAPVVQRTAEYVSRISVENTSDTLEACFQIVYYDEGATRPTAIDPPGPTEGCPRGGELVPPRGTLLRDEHSLPVPEGFDGSAVVQGLTTESGVPAQDQLPAMMVDTREREGPGLSTYRGIDYTEMSRDVVLPVVDRNASEGQTTWTTRFRIFNSIPPVPNELQLLFAGQNADGDEIEIEHEVTLLSALTCDQHVDGIGGCLPEDIALPDTFFGTVRIRAEYPIAVVAQRLSAGGALADYRGFTAAEAAREIVLPVLNKNFGPWGGYDGWNSWFRVVAFDGSRARVNVLYFSSHFPTGRLSPGATVHHFRTLRQWEDATLPDGWVGGAVVIADRPIIVIANLESDVFQGDPVMLYNGIAVQ
ncbi:MAG: hypothetical protein F4X76_13670 [Chloroflexi bacterium]|nr:hypothetical protein [Chloroflexota bacterium]